MQKALLFTSKVLLNELNQILSANVLKYKVIFKQVFILKQTRYIVLNQPYRIIHLNICYSRAIFIVNHIAVNFISHYLCEYQNTKDFKELVYTY